MIDLTVYKWYAVLGTAFLFVPALVALDACKGKPARMWWVIFTWMFGLVFLLMDIIVAYVKMHG